MKSNALVPSFVLALLAASCSVCDPVGTWELDKPAMAAASSTLPAEDLERMLGGIGESTIELAADGTATMRAKVLFDGRHIQDSTTGTWRVEGSTLIVVVKGRGGPDVVEMFDCGSDSLTGASSTARLTMIYRRR